MCYRHRATMFAGPDYPYSDLLQFGVMQEGARDITEVIITDTANNPCYTLVCRATCGGTGLTTRR